MTAEAAALVRSFLVGKRHCTLTFRRPAAKTTQWMSAEWSPTTPRRLNKAEWRQYRAGRDAAMVEFAELLGERILLVEV